MVNLGFPEIIILGLYLVVWVGSAVSAFRRNHPIWGIVIIFAPLIGVLGYWIFGRGSAARSSSC